ncbi:MAG: DUF1849 family protein [Alphaproteobacteria bacterium]|nr:DUF1849 family protein [Alphaproteobacteria bacterium]
MSVRLPRRLGAAAMSAAIALGAPPAMAAPFAPHKAVYKLESLDLGDGAGLSGADGAISLEWKLTCEGFVTNQRMITRLFGLDGEVQLGDLTVSTFEPSDFSSLRFTIQSLSEGTLAEDYFGTARKGREEAPGEIAYTRPETQTAPLPAKAVFPSEHALGILSSAGEGKRWHEAVVFEGGAPEEIYRVITFIGNRRTGDAGGEGAAGPQAAQAALAGLSFWPVTLTYYDLELGDGLPRYEARFHLYENGVSDELTLDYGSFSVHGTLRELEILDRPSC